MLCELLPDDPPRPKRGRPRADRRQALKGIFRILDNGAKWKSLPEEYGAKSSVYRRLQRWVKTGAFEKIPLRLGELVQEKEGYKIDECYIDGTFSKKTKGGGDGIGCTKA